MADRTPHSRLHRMRTLGLLLLAGLVVLALAGRAQAQVAMTAAAFFGDCSIPITVTQDTRVSGAATVAGSCDVTVNPGVTLVFINASVKVDALSIAGTDGAVRVVSSRVETANDVLGIDLSQSGPSSAVVINSVLKAATDLVILAAAAVSTSGTQLTAGDNLDIAAFAGAATITSSRLESSNGQVVVLGQTNASVTSSTLAAATFLTVKANTGAVAAANSRLQVSNGVLLVVGRTASVAGSLLTATGGAVDVLADTGVMVTSSQLQSTTSFLQVAGLTKTAVASSVLTAASVIVVGLVGPTSVQASRFTGSTLSITPLDATTSAALNTFTGVTGTVTISGTRGCTSIKNNPDTPCS